MSIDRLIISNLRRAQSLDTSLRTAAGIEKIAAAFVDSVMFNPVAASRATAIAKLEAQLVVEAVQTVLPQAGRIGTINANDIIAKIPSPIDLGSAAERKGALFNNEIRAADRVTQVKLSVTGAGDTLENRLLRYYLQPAEGTADEKVKRLQDLHTKLEERRTSYDKKVREFNAGELKTRPSKPELDYMSELTEDVKSDVKTQARRAATDAEIATFQRRGHTAFGWVVPNGHSACPDCQLRAGVVLTIDQWESVGRPGSGMTICEDHCFCMLVPRETFIAAPGLAATFQFIKPVKTTAEQLVILNANRIKE